MIGLNVSEIEFVGFPVVESHSTPVGNPEQAQVFRTDVIAHLRKNIGIRPVVFRNPVKTLQVEVLVTFFLEAVEETVDVPFAGFDAIFIFGKIHRTIKVSPVFLPFYRRRNPDNQLMPERRFAHLFDLLIDALVERRKSFVLLELAFHQPFPFGAPGCFFFIPGSIIAAFAVFEFEKQEPIEQPVFFALLILVNYIRGKLVFGPFHVAVRTALIDQYQIGNVGFGVLWLCAFVGGQPQHARCNNCC